MPHWGVLQWGVLQWGGVAASAVVHLLYFNARRGGRLLGEADRGLRLMGAACMAGGVMAMAPG